MTMADVRKHTKFQTCQRHRYLDTITDRGNGRVSRTRRAEIFMEGGPADEAGCIGGRCRIWPGTDLFVADICHDEYALTWTCPRSTTAPRAAPRSTPWTTGARASGPGSATFTRAPEPRARVITTGGAVPMLSTSDEREETNNGHARAERTAGRNPGSYQAIAVRAGREAQPREEGIMSKYRFVVEVKINNPPATYEDEILDEIAEWLDSAQQECVYWTTDDGDEKAREIKDWTVRLYLGRLDTDPED